MDNYRPWAVKRRVIYGTSFVSTWVMIGVLVFFVGFYQPPNCFDGKLNGNETDVDAGGDCVRIAGSVAAQPDVVWAESFEIMPGQYNAVAYIENRNVTAATPELRYTFRFYNETNEVAVRSGTTALPPNSSYPVFEGRVRTTDGQPITRTELVLEPVELWLPAIPTGEQFRTVDINLQNPDSNPELLVSIENITITPAQNVEVVATIFNELGDPVTASETFIESFPAQSVEDIVFTWPQSIAKTVRSCTIPTDVVLGIDLSGSMNNDQANPPQPVTDALAAASSFVQNLRSGDQVGVVTFATEARVVQELTPVHTAAAALIEQLTIDPASETGFTNTADAIELAAQELSSERHDDDARRAFVLLTDGLPTASGDFDAISAAQDAARAAALSGADVYAIGLGTQVDQSFIRGIASEFDHAYLAPTRGDLDQIYSQITASLCESGPTKIEVIAKPQTNFAPLR